MVYRNKIVGKVVFCFPERLCWLPRQRRRRLCCIESNQKLFSCAAIKIFPRPSINKYRSYYPFFLKIITSNNVVNETRSWAICYYCCVTQCCQIASVILTGLLFSQKEFSCFFSRRDKSRDFNLALQAVK